jgi:excisionase family DNA binding protein
MTQINHSPTSPRILLRVHEAAELLGLSRAMVYQLLAAGQSIPVVRIGRCVRIPRAELEAWVAQQTEEWRPSPLIGPPR